MPECAHTPEAYLEVVRAVCTASCQVGAVGVQDPLRLVEGLELAARVGGTLTWRREGKVRERGGLAVPGFQPSRADTHGQPKRITHIFERIGTVGFLVENITDLEG